MRSANNGQVTFKSYLDIESHWRAILLSLFRHNTSGLATFCRLDEYCVIALSRENVGHGNVMGTLGARYTLVVLNDSDTHFDPCMKLDTNVQLQ